MYLVVVPLLNVVVDEEKRGVSLGVRGYLYVGDRNELGSATVSTLNELECII